jgi:hypothetical protein
MKDVYHYWNAPRRTVINKLHPVLNTVAEMLANKDFYGTQIRNQDDPLVQQAISLGLHALNSFKPFSVRGYEKLAKEDIPVHTRLLPFIGITPAPADINKTEAEKEMSRMYSLQQPIGGRTKEQAEKAESRRILRHSFKGKSDAEIANIISRAVNSKTVTEKEADYIWDRRNESGLVSGFGKLTVPEAIKIWQKATPEEKATLYEAFDKKIDNAFQAGKLDDKTLREVAAIFQQYEQTQSRLPNLINEIKNPSGGNQ